MSHDARKLDRRTFLAGTGGAGAALTGLGIEAAARPASSAPSISASDTGASAVSVTVAGSGGASLDWRAEQAYRLCRATESAVPGDLFIRDALPGEPVDATFLDATQLAALDPAFAFIGGLPGTYALDARDLAAWYDHGGGADAISALAGDHGLHLILAGHGGSNRLWCRLDGASIGPGVSVSTVGLARDVARGLGATLADPTDEDPTDEDPTGAEQIVADVIETAPGPAVTSGLARRYKSVHATAFAPLGTTLVLALTQKATVKLGRDRIARLTAVARSQYATAVAEARSHDTFIMDGFLATGGRVKPADPGFASAIDAISRAVVAQTAAASASARRIDASYAAFRRAIGRAIGTDDGRMQQYTS